MHLRPSNAQTLAQPNNPPLYLLPTAHRSTLDACAPSMARLAHASVIRRPSSRVKSIPGRTLDALPLFLSRRFSLTTQTPSEAVAVPSWSPWPWSSPSYDKMPRGTAVLFSVDFNHRSKLGGPRASSSSSSPPLHLDARRL